MKIKNWVFVVILMVFCSLGIVAQSVQTYSVNGQLYIKAGERWYSADSDGNREFFVDAEVITVKFREHVTEDQKNALHLMCSGDDFRISRSGFVDIRIKKTDDVTKVLEEYRESGLCEYVELNTVAKM